MTLPAAEGVREPLPTVILCGGLGTRIRSVAGDLPKSMLPVAGRPFIAHQLELLRGAGVREVILCVGYGASRIQSFVGDGAAFGLSVRYAREDPDRLLGTGGALVHALPLLPDRFFVLYGDSWLPVDYGQIGAAFVSCSCPAMMTVLRNEGRWDASNARVRDGRVVFYSKRAGPGEADWIDYGLNAFRREVIERYRPAAMPLDLAAILEDLVAAGELAAYEVTERFYEIGRPESYRELDELLRARGA